MTTRKDPRALVDDLKDINISNIRALLEGPKANGNYPLHLALVAWTDTGYSRDLDYQLLVKLTQERSPNALCVHPQTMLALAQHLAETEAAVHLAPPVGRTHKASFLAMGLAWTLPSGHEVFVAANNLAWADAVQMDATELFIPPPWITAFPAEVDAFTTFNWDRAHFSPSTSAWHCVDKLFKHDPSAFSMGWVRVLPPRMQQDLAMVFAKTYASLQEDRFDFSKHTGDEADFQLLQTRLDSLSSYTASMQTDPASLDIDPEDIWDFLKTQPENTVFDFSTQVLALLSGRVQDETGGEVSRILPKSGHVYQLSGVMPPDALMASSKDSVVTRFFPPAHYKGIRAETYRKLRSDGLSIEQAKEGTRFVLDLRKDATGPSLDH